MLNNKMTTKEYQILSKAISDLQVKIADSIVRDREEMEKMFFESFQEFNKILREDWEEITKLSLKLENAICSFFSTSCSIIASIISTDSGCSPLLLPPLI